MMCTIECAIARNNSVNDLLTSRQVQEILKVDRITVYRMLNDGRLKGVKIGQQWRFHNSEVERLLGMNIPSTKRTASQVLTRIFRLTACRPFRICLQKSAKSARSSSICREIHSPRSAIQPIFARFSCLPPAGPTPAVPPGRPLRVTVLPSTALWAASSLPALPACTISARRYWKRRTDRADPRRAVLLAAGRSARRSAAHPPPGCRAQRIPARLAGRCQGNSSDCA